MGNQVFDEKQAIFNNVTLDHSALSADLLQALGISAHMQDFRADACIATSTETTDVVVEVGTVYTSSQSVFYSVGAMVVPAGAGNGTVPSVDLLSCLPATLSGFVVGRGYLFAIRVAAIPASGEDITFTFIGGEL